MIPLRGKILLVFAGDNSLLAISSTSLSARLKRPLRKIEKSLEVLEQKGFLLQERSYPEGTPLWALTFEGRKEMRRLINSML